MACSGDTVTLSSRLNIHDYASYERIGGNNLAGRTLQIFRNSSYYTFDGTDGSAGTNKNWSTSVSVTTSSTVAYTFYAKYTSVEAELGDKTSSSFTVTWYPLNGPPFLC